MKQCQQGFTLIELAIVLVVLTLLAGGVLVPLTKQIEVERIRSTRQIMEDTKQALIGYAMSHTATNGKPYLPCPDIDNNGTEDRNLATGQCIRTEGIFPWATLGVGNADAWGNRLRYRVATDLAIPQNHDFANSTSGFGSSTTIDGKYQIRVVTPPNSTYTDPAGTPGIPVIAAIVVSNGPNGWGAMNSNGVSEAAPTSADEQENLNGDPTFISRSPSEASPTTTEFDDIVTWLPTSTLLARVCPAGGCP
ncbi:MAG: type II secretion system protein [Thiobacillaceae bacterium]